MRAASDDPRNVDATQFGQRITLGPNWLFAPGDNPAWAAPGFDDSGWTNVSQEKLLIDYGFHDFRYGWYRVHVHLRPGANSLAVALQFTNGSFEIYANGVRIGGAGPFPPMNRFNHYGFVGYPIPDNVLTPNGDLLLAIRFGLNSVGTRGRGTSTPIDYRSEVLLLSREAVDRERSFADERVIVPQVILAGLSMITGLVAFALFLAMRSQREYLAAAVYMLAWTGYYFSFMCWDVSVFTFQRGLLGAFFFSLIGVSLIEFICRVLGVRRSRWIFTLQIITYLSGYSNTLSALPFFPYYFGFAAFYFPMMFVDGMLVALMIRGWMRGNMEARVLVPAFLLITFADYWNFFNYLIYYLHFLPAYHPLPIVHIAGYGVSLLSIGDFFSFITVLLFLVLRTVSIARRHATVSAELEAARTTQQLLLSRASQPTPGFDVKSVYYPASEVGGDFFLVSTTPSGGLIAIVGDVSGKGLQAAMRVSMIMGALRREDSLEPAAVLHNLNEALLSQSDAGFTTACCIAVDREGSYTLANAGHIAPYLDGEQVATPPALPLGLAADQHYDAIAGSLGAKETLVLISDGVLEARSAEGELFGFDRVAEISTGTAENIAQTARAFGQEDDITVLTLTLAATA
jgi:hypothetical protein